MMRIEHLEVNNFKSLVGFKMDFAPFTCLIGLNGAGKSTVLQFVDFLGQMVRGDIAGWLKLRGWNANELKSNLTKKQLITFDIRMNNAESDEPLCRWTGQFNPTALRCTSEKIMVFPDDFIEVKEGSYVVGKLNAKRFQKIPFDYQGSIISQLKEDSDTEPFHAFKSFFKNIRSLDLLAPHLLRKRTREAGEHMGLGGENFSAFIHEMSSYAKKDVVELLKKQYSSLANVSTKSLKSGWKQLEIEEQFGNEKLTTEARHVNDGLLRLLAIIVELRSDHQFVIFDEIENGINPELVEFAIQELTQSKAQTLVTTHSPMILNYLDDEVARKSVIYLYRNAAGHTQAIPFFKIPSVDKKLGILGPGEVFVDTSLPELQKEIQQLGDEE